MLLYYKHVTIYILIQIIVCVGKYKAIIVFLSILFLFFCGSGFEFRTSCFYTCQVVLHHLSHASAFCCFSYFVDRVLYFCLRSGLDPLFFYLYLLCSVVGIADTHQHTQLVCWNGVLLTFFLGWTGTSILLISVSWVSGITSVLHYAYPVFYLMYLKY
jgi:hypothetical protein